MSLLALVFDAAPLKCFTMDPLKKGERVRGYCPVEKPLLSVQKVAAWMNLWHLPWKRITGSDSEVGNVSGPQGDAVGCWTQDIELGSLTQQWATMTLPISPCRKKFSEEASRTWPQKSPHFIGGWHPRPTKIRYLEWPTVQLLLFLCCWFRYRSQWFSNFFLWAIFQNKSLLVPHWIFGQGWGGDQLLAVLDW